MLFSKSGMSETSVSHSQLRCVLFISKIHILKSHKISALLYVRIVYLALAMQNIQSGICQIFGQSWRHMDRNAPR